MFLRQLTSLVTACAVFSTPTALDLSEVVSDADNIPRKETKSSGQTEQRETQLSSSGDASTSAMPAELQVKLRQDTKGDDSCEKAFHQFVQRFHKSYASPDSRATHLEAFCHNYDFIAKHNAEDHSYTLGVTEFADLTTEEFKTTYGVPKGYIANLSAMWDGAPELKFEPLLTTSFFGLPSSVDWRSSNAVSHVQNQGRCGSCWAFAAAGAMEGAWKIGGGPLLTLSPQQFTDCAGGKYGNNGCQGGNPANAMVYARDNDICTVRSYPYEGIQGSCRAQNCAVGIPRRGIRGYKPVPEGDEQALMQAASQQPVAVAIDGESPVFQHYVGGVITSPTCGDSINHGVLLVGYGSDGGKDYWIIKNSWGPAWGEDGFVRLGRGVSGTGECGILTQASYAVIDPAKIVPGSFDIDPGTAAVVATVLVPLAIIAWCWCKNKGGCKCRWRRTGAQESMLPRSQPTPIQPPAFIPQPSAPPPAAPSSTAAPEQGRSGNSGQSRLLNQ